jgi:hypothetical protein
MSFDKHSVRYVIRQPTEYFHACKKKAFDEKFQYSRELLLPREIAQCA